MFQTVQDIRHAVRFLRRTPGFALAAVASIAIGVGANTAIFTVTSALVLRPLPYPSPGRLVILWNRSPGLGISEDWFSTAQYFDIKGGHHGFEALAIAIGANYNLTGDGPPERLGTIRVSSSLLPMLGARPLHGRLFRSEDDLPGGTGSAVLAYGTWMRRYGGDAGAVGRSITLNGQPYEIVGILPETFTLPREVVPTLGGAEQAEILLPLPLGADASRVRNREDYNVIGRLAPGVSLGEAQADMDAITARLRAEHPDVYPPAGGLTFGIVPLQEQVVGGSVRTALLVLAGAVAFVLLIACANVANLMLSRAFARQKELAVRAALGATRGRIVRQVLTEGVLVGCAGGALGLLLAFLSVRAIRVLGTGSVPRLGEVAINPQVLFFTALVSIASGALSGLVPAVRLSGIDLQSTLKGGTGGSPRPGWRRGDATRRLLVVGELALSVVLLIGAGLLIRSFASLQAVSPGFNPSNVLTLELTMTGRKYGDVESVIEMYRRLWLELRRLPGVTAAGGISALPLSRMMAWGPIAVEGRTPPGGGAFINVDQRVAGGDYFRAMEIPRLQGRLFTPEDTRSQARVIVVDELMAHQIWPGESPLGKRVRIGGMDASPNAPWLTVVGVVGRIKQDALDAESRMAMYFPHTQSPARAMNVVVRGGGEAAMLTAAVRSVLAGLDPDLPMYRVRTMRDRVNGSLAERRFSMLLLTVFAALALSLAIMGTYGVMSYLVGQSTRELGIRLALGATPRGILALVVREGMALAVLGVGLGLAGAAVLTRLLRSLLFGVRASDPATYVAMAALLAVVALVAIVLPARRAARTDPLLTLRSE